jgi:hypothetical protein
MCGGRSKYITAEVYVFSCDPLLPEWTLYVTQDTNLLKINRCSDQNFVHIYHLSDESSLVLLQNW